MQYLYLSFWVLFEKTQILEECTEAHRSDGEKTSSQLFLISQTQHAWITNVLLFSFYSLSNTFWTISTSPLLNRLFWTCSTLPACWLVTGEVNHTPILPIRGTCIHVDYYFFVRKCIEKKCLVFIWMDTLLNRTRKTNLSTMNARCEFKVRNVSTTDIIIRST